MELINKNFFFIVCCILILLPIRASSSELIYSYGFENWTGDRYTTANYPFSSTYTVFCQEHDDCSEVVTVYNGWTPHTDNYFFLRNDSQHSMSPPVAGIPGGDVNDNGYIGLNGSPCSTNDLELESAITTGEIFIRFWARISEEFGSIGGRCKWIVLNLDNDTVFMHLTTSNGISPDMHLHAEDQFVTDSGHVATNAYDGNWHKFSFYVNVNTGTVRGWYDTENEQPENALVGWVANDGDINGSNEILYFKIQGNFSSDFPESVAYHAIDDLEVWDGMPDTTTSYTYYPYMIDGSIIAIPQ